MEDRLQDAQDALNVQSIERGPRIEELERLAREAHDAVITIQERMKGVTAELSGIEKDTCDATELADKSHDQIIELGVKLKYISTKQDVVIARLDNIDAAQDTILGKVASLTLKSATEESEQQSFIQKYINTLLMLVIGALVSAFVWFHH